MEIFVRVRFKGMVAVMSAKYLMQNVLLEQKKDWSLSQGREFMAVTGNKIAKDKKVDKAVDEAVVEVLGVVLHCNQLNVKFAELLHRAVLLYAGQCNLM